MALSRRGVAGRVWVAMQTICEKSEAWWWPTPAWLRGGAEGQGRGQTRKGGTRWRRVVVVAYEQRWLPRSGVTPARLLRYGSDWRTFVVMMMEVVGGEKKGGQAGVSASATDLITGPFQTVRNQQQRQQQQQQHQQQQPPPRAVSSRKEERRAPFCQVLDSTDWQRKILSLKRAAEPFSEPFSAQPTQPFSAPLATRTDA
ncbi:hypothetical protein L1887_57900 [Cichorium endivia]|nr:hypothetical protein L1887_57900 [Cichorium endivia]